MKKNPVRTARAIARLKVADHKLAANDRRERKAGVTKETPEFHRLNRAVAEADADPYLPDRFRDPRDRAN